MAVQQVYQPEKKQDNSFQTLGQLGGLISMIPHPVAKGVGGGMMAVGTLGAMTQKPEKYTPQASPVEGDLNMPDYSQAIARREKQLAQDPYQGLVDAKAALSALDVDDETKLRLQKPLDAAIAAQRSIG